MNILLFTCILLISIVTTHFCNKYLKKFGLICLFTSSSVISYILTFKYITFQTINYNANSITYVTMLTALYLLLETTNKKEVRKILNLNLTLNIFICITLYILSIYTPSLNDSIGINMKNVFFNNYRILIAFPVST